MLSVKRRNVKREQSKNTKTERPKIQRSSEKCSSRAKRPKVIKNPTRSSAYADKPARRDGSVGLRYIFCNVILQNFPSSLSQPGSAVTQGHRKWYRSIDSVSYVLHNFSLKLTVSDISKNATTLKRRGHSRVTPYFNIPSIITYCRYRVVMDLSHIVFDIFDFENTVTSKSG